MSYREVDESLFASKNTKKAKARSDGSAGLDAPSQLSGFFSGGGSTSVRRGRPQSTLRIVTKDQVRTLRVPKKQNDPENLVIPWSEYCRVKDHSKIRSPDEMYTQVLEKEALNDHKAEQSRARRKEFEILDQTRNAGSQETELDVETRKREQALLANARNQLAEQDDEIKKLNELILEAKVKTVRDKQLWEKQSIKKTVQEHEYQVDMMMEEERVRKVLEAEQKTVARREQLMKGRQDIEEQIDEKDLRKTLQDEIKAQEQKAMLEKLQLLHLEDFENAQQKRAEARALMQDVERANQMAIDIRRGKEDAERMEAVNMARYLEEKARQEQDLEESGLRKKALWERKQAAMIEQQDNQKNIEVQQQNLLIKRSLDAVERKARKENAIKRQRDTRNRQDLVQGLDMQIQQRSVELNTKASSERYEFEENAKALLDVIDIEKGRAAELKVQAFENKNGVIQQIKEKERTAVRERKEFFEEGEQITRQAEERSRRLAEIKQSKLEALKATGIDQQAIDQVCTAIDIHGRRQKSVAA